MNSDLSEHVVIVDETCIDEITTETFTRQRINPERLRDAEDYDSILFNQNKKSKSEIEVHNI